MRDFLHWLCVWALFALAPIFVLTGFVSFVTLDPSLLNPSTWHEGGRFLAGVWTICITILVFATAIKHYREENDV